MFLACVAAVGCGRSGSPDGPTGTRELVVIAPPANAGAISVVIDAQAAGVCPPMCGTFGFDVFDDHDHFGTYLGKTGRATSSVNVGGSQLLSPTTVIDAR